MRYSPLHPPCRQITALRVCFWFLKTSSILMFGNVEVLQVQGVGVTGAEVGPGVCAPEADTW